jgi:TPR repeat protein
VWWMSFVASAATLPGVSLPFDVGADGRWRIGGEVPPAMAAAGVEAGWLLVAVDDLEWKDTPEWKDGLAARRLVADGPSRDLRLRFETGTPGETTVVIVRRGRLVFAERATTVALPDGFTAAPGWRTDRRGRLVLRDAGGAQLALAPAAGTFEPVAGDTVDHAVPEVFWHLSDDPWAVDRGGNLDVSAVATARDAFAGAAWLPSFGDDADDALLVARERSVDVFRVHFPRGTPPLPSCSPLVPETCLASARDLVTQLGAREGALTEARRQLGLACDAGVHRACFEAVALDEPALAPDARACTEGALPACQRVAQVRFERDGATIQPETLGLLELTCDLEGAGSLADRLLRVEDVGAGCARLAEAYDLDAAADLALLALDRACVLGRAESCDLASARRDAAFAARTVRECEDPEHPVAPACVDLGRLLQRGPVPAATLGEFDAFLRGCALGSTDGCFLLGDYVDRWGVSDPRVAKAEHDLSASCETGEVRACLGAGHLLVRHEPRSAEYGRALLLFDQACDQGLGEACVAGAEQRRIGEARRVEAPDQPTMLSAACSLSNAAGCSLLAERLARRSDTVPGAYDAWLKACDLGDPHACTELGGLVLEPHDPLYPHEQPSAAFLARGCDEGDPEGCFELAEPQLPPRGEPPEAAYVLLSRSCDGDFGEACARLADVHLDRDTSFDEEVAARHLEDACANSWFPSCKELGVMYARGRGVERDRARARELLDRFRRNAPRRYLRLGLQGGLPSAAGGEVELVLPVPAPALSIAAAYSFLPYVGTVLPLLKGREDPDPDTAPNGADYRYLGLTARLYPNPRARGLYGFGGFDQVRASGGYLPAGKTYDRTGWRGGVGLRTDNKFTFVGLEAGLGWYGAVDLTDFDEDSNPGKIPVIQTTFALSVGLAPF